MYITYALCLNIAYSLMFRDMTFGEMAAKREQEAALLTDNEIYRSMISKFLQLVQFPIEDRANMIFDSISDNRFVYEELKALAAKGIIDSHEMTKLLIIMSKRVMNDNNDIY